MNFDMNLAVQSLGVAILVSIYRAIWKMQTDLAMYIGEFRQHAAQDVRDFARITNDIAQVRKEQQDVAVALARREIAA